MTTDHEGTADSDLGPMPDATTEPPEPNPGGADAMPTTENEVVPADQPADLNPAINEARTPSLTEGEDTSTQATRADGPGSTDGTGPVDAKSESPD